MASRVTQTVVAADGQIVWLEPSTKRACAAFPMLVALSRRTVLPEVNLRAVDPLSSVALLELTSAASTKHYGGVGPVLHAGQIQTHTRSQCDAQTLRGPSAQTINDVCLQV